MKDYKQIHNAVKAFVKQTRESNTGTFVCTVNGKLLQINYQCGPKPQTIGMDVCLGDVHYLINNIHSQSSDSEFQIYFDTLSLIYSWVDEIVYVKTENSGYLPISTTSIPKEDYLQLCHYFKHYSYSHNQ